ncbi:OmpA Outer membrane protein and related peptidoglycan-associated (lipo)proteins [Spirosomataceae bacterium]|jgi:OOP family OmpA-OmpF porin
MNRLLIPLLILLGSLLFSWFWNCNRKDYCPDCQPKASVTELASVPVLADTVTVQAEDTTQANLTPEEKVLFEPLDVYFQSGKSSINRTEEINTWLSTAKTYLEKNPNEKLSLTGYTDSDGDDDSNIVLSKKRADIVKAILVKDGFADADLILIGKGETEPIADNDTPENKAKNRRVSIRLIK